MRIGVSQSVTLERLALVLGELFDYRQKEFLWAVFQWQC